MAETAGQRYRLDPLRWRGADPVVTTSAFDPRTGAFTVPARTVAVVRTR